MKALYVRKLFLWPRFQAQVKDTLNELPIEVSWHLEAPFGLGDKLHITFAGWHRNSDMF